MKQVYFRTTISGRMVIEGTGDDQSEISEILNGALNIDSIPDYMIVDVQIVK
jgi:hypothetical protein